MTWKQMSLICPECGVPLVPFGGEDICLDFCGTCGGHDCECGYRDDYGDEECECPPEGHMGGCFREPLTALANVTPSPKERQPK